RGRALAARASGAGARLYEWTPALSFTGREVRTPNGRVHCGAVVIAVDGGLEEVVPALRGTVRTTRLQMLATESDPAVQIACPVSLNHGFDYGQQLPDGRIALGGGRNRSFDTEWGAPAEPSEAIQSYLDALLRNRIGSRARVTHRWAARVAYTTSGLPVLAEVEKGVWAAGGYSGTGNLMGTLCGRAAAQLAAGRASPDATTLAALLSGAAPCES
ncbi:MAG: FAD-dependent oxidoreductase, partial [Gemmatimonadota bacterium]|nr:FAD-dependent oxidoreductase [Gemmatimonadota bacterium]